MNLAAVGPNNSLEIVVEEVSGLVCEAPGKAQKYVHSVKRQVGTRLQQGNEEDVIGDCIAQIERNLIRDIVDEVGGAVCQEQNHAHQSQDNTRKPSKRHLDETQIAGPRQPHQMTPDWPLPARRRHSTRDSI
jgi:hypothetical protein